MNYIITTFASIIGFALVRGIFDSYFELLDVKRDWIEYTTKK